MHNLKDSSVNRGDNISFPSRSQTRKQTISI